MQHTGPGKAQTHKFHIMKPHPTAMPTWFPKPCSKCGDNYDMVFGIGCAQSQHYLQEAALIFQSVLNLDLDVK